MTSKRRSSRIPATSPVAGRFQQIVALSNVPLAILVKAIDRVLAIAVLTFANPHRAVKHDKWRTWRRLAIDTRHGDSKNAFPVRTGGGAVERAGLENQFTLRGDVGSNPTLSA